MNGLINEGVVAKSDVLVGELVGFHECKDARVGIFEEG